MADRDRWGRAVWAGLALALAGAMIVSALAGAWWASPDLSRWSSAIVAAALFALWVGVPRAREAPLPPWALGLLLVTALVWLEAASVTHYLAFAINGIDFSVFDWMLESTLRGRPGYSPIYDVNHLGVHSSFVLGLLVPLHALFRSPWLLVVAGPLLVWASLFPLLRLARAMSSHEPPGALQLALVLAWVGSAWLGRLVNLGFRVESFLPVLTLLFLVGQVERRRWLWVLAAAGLLLTKEDSALTLCAYALALALVERPRRKEALGLFVLSAGWLVLYATVLQPTVFGHRPEYGGFWSAFGATPARAAVGMLTHPLEVLSRLASSGVWSFYLPVLFLPFASARAAAGLLPATLLLGSATYEYMHQFGGYYPAVLVPFVFFGLIELWERWRTHVARQGLVLAAVLGSSLTMAGYPVTLAWDPTRFRGAATLRERLADTPRVCAQPILVPHLGYPPAITPLLDPSCLDTPDTVVVVHPALDPSPLDSEGLRELVRGARGRRPIEEVEGGFLILR